MKICERCKKNLPISKFSKRKGGLYHYYCKDCTSEYYKEWYRKNGRIRAIDYIESQLEWSKNHPTAIIAHKKVGYAIRVGKLIKPSLCSICNESRRLSAHHNDYSKPLEVLWVCWSCHKKIHNTIDKTIKED